MVLIRAHGLLLCMVACIVGATEQPVEIFQLSVQPKFSVDAETGGPLPFSAQERGTNADTHKPKASENEASPLLTDGGIESITLHPRMDRSTSWTDNFRSSFRRTASSVTQTGARIFRNLSMAKFGEGFGSDSDSEASPRRNKKSKDTVSEASPTKNKKSKSSDSETSPARNIELKDTQLSKIPSFIKRLASTAGNAKYFPEAIKKRVRRKDRGSGTIGANPADSLDTDWGDADSYDEGHFTVDEPPPSPPRFPRTPQRQDVSAMDSPARKFPELYYRTPLREQPSDEKSPAQEEPLPHDRPVSPKRGESPQRGRSKSPEKMTSSPRKPRPESPERRQSPQREKPKSPSKWRSATRPRSFGRKSKTEDYSKYTRGDHLAGTAEAMQRFMADLSVPMPKGQQTARQEPATTQQGDGPQTGRSSSPSRARPRTPSPLRSGVTAAQLAKELCPGGKCDITYVAEVPLQYRASAHAPPKPKQDSEPQ